MEKTALVTGAADRIGAQIARTLAANGHTLLIHYHQSRTKAEELAERIRKDGGIAHTLCANLHAADQRARLVERATALAGPVHVLVNNASVYEQDTADSLNEELWDLHFDLHAKAPLFLARDFARQLPPDRSGHIINIIDERVLRAHPSHFSYSLSKSVLWTATRTLAQSLAPRIRVNAIGPGPVLPHARQTREQFEDAISRLPLQTSATPQEIADAILFLLDSPSITGQMLTLDGGEHLQWTPDGGQTPASSRER